MVKADFAKGKRTIKKDTSILDADSNKKLRWFMDRFNLTRESLVEQRD